MIQTRGPSASRAICALLGSLAFAPAILGQPAGEASAEEGRPRIGLVLSGGGARGAAHVGVLEALEELRVPIDVIVGTSMGAIVGGLYAAGMSPAELRSLVTETDWPALFQDRPDRAKRYFRRKEDDVDFPVRYRLHFRGGSPRLPLGLLQAQRLGNRLDRLSQELAPAAEFDQLPIPFRAVATDLKTGDAVVIRGGNLSRAMRASMSLPGIFPPVEIDGQLTVDGGVVANLPVGVMQSEFEVDVILAVDISTPLPEGDVESYLGVLLQLQRFLTQGNVARDSARLGQADLLLTPELGDLGTADFERSGEAADLGRRAADAAREQLSKWSVSAVDYERFLEKQRHGVLPPLVVTAIEVGDSGPLRERIVERFVTQPLGEPFDATGLEDDLVRLNGLGVYDAIGYSLTDGGPDGGSILSVTAPEKTIGLTTVQFGLEIEDDFEGGSTYAIATRLQKLALNRRGAEWRTDLRVGDQGGIDTGFYQPLDSGLRFFAGARALFERDDIPFFVEAQPVAQVRSTRWGGAIDFGRNLGTWGQARASLARVVLDGEVTIGPELTLGPFDQTVLDLALRFDTVDSPNWPSRGVLGNLDWQRAVDLLGGEFEGERINGNADFAFSVGRYRVVPGAEAIVTIEDDDDPFAGASLGGLFRLSGYAPFELFGDEAVLGRVVAYRRLNRKVIRRVPASLYAGLSIEGGNVFRQGESIDADELLYGATAFIGADTPLGPLIFGFGYSDPDRTRAYLAFGRSFF